MTTPVLHRQQPLEVTCAYCAWTAQAPAHTPLQSVRWLQAHGFLVVKPSTRKVTGLKAADRCIRPFCTRPRESRRHRLCDWHSEAAR